MPIDYDQFQYEVEKPAINLYSEVADYKIIQIKISRNGDSQKILLHIFTQKQERGPFPVILLISHRPLESLVANVEDQFFSIEKIVERGSATVAFDVEFVSPDDKECFSDGILETLYPEQLKLPNSMRGIICLCLGGNEGHGLF